MVLPYRASICAPVNGWQVNLPKDTAQVRILSAETGFRLELPPSWDNGNVSAVASEGISLEA